MIIKCITIAVGIIILGIVLELIRKEKLTFKYAFGWIVVSLLAVFFGIFDKLLFRLAYLVGFQLPSNFIFFGMFCVFVFLTLMMTIFLCQQNNRNDTMAQKIGILEFEIKQLKEEQELNERVNKSS